MKLGKCYKYIYFLIISAAVVSPNLTKPALPRLVNRPTGQGGHLNYISYIYHIMCSNNVLHKASMTTVLALMQLQT